MAIILPILTTFNAAGIKAAQAGLGGFGAALGKFGRVAAGATAAIQGVSKAIDFVSESVDSARDLERNLFALNTVFDDLAPRMEAFTKNAWTMGISQTEAARTATFLGSVLKQAGFSMEDVADQTQKLTILAQDLATTYGYDTSEALTAMTALFRGEYDPIEKFGVALKQNEVNALLAAKGLDHLTGQALLNAQQQIRLEQLYLRSADAQGAFAEQSGTLFVEQKKLNAVWESLQATAGTALTPAITQLMATLTPLIQEQAPNLTYLFEQMGETLINLIPLIPPLVSIFGSLIKFTGQLIEILNPLIEVLGIGLAVAFELVADLLTHLTDGIEDIIGWFESLFATVDMDWENSQILNWIKDFISQSVILSTILSPVLKIFERLGELAGAKENRKQQAEFKAQGLSDWAKYEAFLTSRSAEAVASTVTPSAKTGTNAIASFYANLKNEIKKQSAKLKLQKLGASEALIESILGSGADWNRLFQKILAGGQKMVAKLQKQFNKTAAGLNEIAAAQKAAAEAAAQAAEEARQAAEELKRLRTEFAASIREGFGGIIAKDVPAMGRFEQAVVDSFGNIKQAIADVDNKVLQNKQKAIFLGLAEFAQQQLAKIAKKRDDLATKIETTKSFMDSVKDSIFGQVNLADMGKTATAIISNFKRIIQRSVEFRKNIALLSQAGLNSTALQQIVAGGAEAGGAAAKALVRGGAGAISQVNDLFGQLDSVASGVAETAGQTLYGAGVDASNGLIEGLLAQESELKKAAETLADSFKSAFDKRLGLEKPEFSPIGVAGTSKAGTVINLTVNAPMGTGNSIGKLIIDEINRYERTSGAVFVRA